MSNIIIPIWLRDTYARIENHKISDVDGYSSDNNSFERKAFDSMHKEFDLGNGDIFKANSKFYISGGDIYNYLYEKKQCNNVITMVIIGLKDLYWNHRDQLDEHEISLLTYLMTKDLPSFKNIFDYRKVEKYNEKVDIPIHQLFGSITPYDVVHISVADFIEAINNNEPVRINLEGTNITIQLDYEPYDFYNFKEKRLVTKIKTCY